MNPSAFHARRISFESRSAELRALVQACHLRAGEPAPVLVFDLDGTILDNRPRVARIFHELAEAWREAHPLEAERLAAARAEAIVYGVVDNLERLGVHDRALQERASLFWRERFFTDAYMRYDVETPGARSFVCACYEAGATVVYLTGRDLPNMALGTFASLRDRGFPIGVVGTSLVTKPTFELPDAAFKDAVAPSLARHGHVVATFDNEPANCNLFLEHHPLARTFFLDTSHAPEPPPLDARAVVIDSFEVGA